MTSKKIDLYCVNCLKVNDDLGKITMYYDDKFKIYACCDECDHRKYEIYRKYKWFIRIIIKQCDIIFWSLKKHW